MRKPESKDKIKEKYLAQDQTKKENERKILNALFNGKKDVKDLSIETKLSHQTLSIRLAELQKNKEIMLTKQTGDVDRRRRVYELTSKGFERLNIIDDRLKVQAFSRLLGLYGMGGVNMLTAFDHRLPEKCLQDLKNAFEDQLIQGAEKGVNETSISEFFMLVNKVYKENNISPPYKPNKDILDEAKRFLGDIIFFLVVKSLKENRPVYLKYIFYLPWFVSEAVGDEMDLDYLASHITTAPQIENILNKCQNLTIDEYKNLTEDVKEILQH